MKIPKKVDPAVSFTCATCKRIRPVAARQKDRLVCADRADCAHAFADQLATERFPIYTAVKKPG